MLFEPTAYKHLFDLFFEILTPYIINIYIPRAGMSVLDVGHADGGVADPVVHHRVHTHGHAVLGQHLTCL